MHLLVTGGAGFIGSAFIRLVLDQQPTFRITNLDALTYAGNLDNLEGLSPERHHFIRGDITNRNDVAIAMERCPDGIVNFAAESHEDRSIQCSDAFLRT